MKLEQFVAKSLHCVHCNAVNLYYATAETVVSFTIDTIFALHFVMKEYEHNANIRYTMWLNDCEFCLRHSLTHHTL